MCYVVYGFVDKVGDIVCVIVYLVGVIEVWYVGKCEDVCVYCFY